MFIDVVSKIFEVTSKQLNTYSSIYLHYDHFPPYLSAQFQLGCTENLL